MQVLLQLEGALLTRIEGHVRKIHKLLFMGNERLVNSYHNFGCYDVPSAYSITAKSKDGIVEAISHQSLPWLGMMWHPERQATFSLHDINLFSKHFYLRPICKD